MLRTSAYRTSREPKNSDLAYAKFCSFVTQGVPQ
jgi:hypothetical protein